MGYDAVNVGEKDLMMGLTFLLEVTQKAKFPFLSANLVDIKTQRGFFKSHVIKEISGIKIGIIGLLDDQFNAALKEREPGLVIQDPFSISGNIIKSLKPHCDLIVVLSQLGEMKDKRLAREHRDIHLILGGGGESMRAVAERVNETPIYRLEPRGGYLGRMDYSLADTKRPIQFLISSEQDELEKRLGRLIARTDRIKAEIAKAGSPEGMKAKELKLLESNQKEIEKSLMTFHDKNFYPN